MAGFLPLHQQPLSALALDFNTAFNNIDNSLPNFLILSCLSGLILSIDASWASGTFFQIMFNIQIENQNTGTGKGS